ncbi:MAG: FecR domain-containing protein [Proteobacteria bacterium]|nr:FecR domain-containing protein [Pseudomonadota bacterium]
MMRGKAVPFLVLVFLVLALGLPVSRASGAVKSEGWIAELVIRLQGIRAEAERKVQAAERAAAKADEIVALAREENDPAAGQVAARARANALAAGARYQRVRARAEASLESAEGLSELVSRDSAASRGAGILFREGDVRIRRESNPQWQEPGQADRLLRPGDSIRTGKGGSVELRLMADGSRVDVGPETSFKVEDEDTVCLDFGKVLFDIRNWLEGKKRRFEVRTPAAVCAVRGTRFGVFTDPGGKSTLFVLEGEVEFAGPGRKGAVAVSGSRKSILLPGGEPSPPTEFDPAEIRDAFEPHSL